MNKTEPASNLAGHDGLTGTVLIQAVDLSQSFSGRFKSLLSQVVLLKITFFTLGISIPPARIHLGASGELWTKKTCICCRNPLNVDPVSPHVSGLNPQKDPGEFNALISFNISQ